MNRIDRLTAILILLQSRKIVTAETIAQRFGISRRTIYRDLAALGEAGIPIGAEAGLGYYLAQGYSLPPVMFTSYEAAALVTAGKMIEKLSDTSIDNGYKSALEKIRAILPSKDKELLDGIELNTEVYFSASSNKPEFPNHFLLDLQKAASDHLQVKIDYCSGAANEITKNRLVEPILICFYSMAWHLLAFCKLRNDYRDFRLDRILSIQPTNQHFKPYPIKSATDYFNLNYPKLTNYHIRLKLDKKTSGAIQNVRYYYGFVEEKHFGTKTEMHFINTDLDSFARWLLMFAEGLEIIEPVELKNVFHRKLEQIVKRHP